MILETTDISSRGHNGAAQILVVDDDENLRLILTDRLVGSGFRVLQASSIAGALEALERESCQLILLDIFLSDQSGLEGLKEIRNRYQGLPVVVMTAHGTIDLAVEAMKEGAYEFITKPLDFKRLGVLVERAIESSQLRTEVDYLRRAADGPFTEIIGEKSGLRETMELVRSVADSDTTILLRGETGTGKEVIARATHRLSPRRRKPFVVANCAAIPRELMESEMFGHVKGAFTGAISNHAGFFETAGSGSLHLDEIGDLNLDLQAKILRVLEDGSFRKVGSSTTQYSRSRIIASTHQNLERLIEKGRFREDLYYRLNVFPINLPPLRHRKEDIPDLARYFLRISSGRSSVKSTMIGEEAMALLVEYPWPGNLRELRNFMERLAITIAGRTITPDDVSLLLRHPAVGRLEVGICSLKEIERQTIVETLERLDGNRTRTAEALGIGRRTLQNKLKSYGIAE